jgi:Family of unknown function (DUF5681)
MRSNDNERSGRVPPPEAHRFLKGTSGNKRGRPKGSISIKSLTRKVALRKHRLGPGEKAKPLLQLVLEALVRGSAVGASSFVSLYDETRNKIAPLENGQPGGLLVVPAEVSQEEWIAEMEARNATAREPGTYVNYKADEFCKAAAGISTPLGEALLASHRRWGHIAGE